MKKRVTLLEIAICLFCVGCVVGSAIFTFAATGSPVTIPVTATIPSLNNLTVTLSRAPAGGGNFTNASSIDFGTLNFDNTNKVFTSQWYYAADVGTESNADWTVSHSIASIRNATLNSTLDDHVNVIFVKKGAGTSNETQFSNATFTNSTGKSFVKSQFSGGYWLRIYYGIATGNVTTDATGAKPIGVDQPAGRYDGSATITMAP
jgi:hypothetical protein